MLVGPPSAATAVTVTGHWLAADCSVPVPTSAQPGTPASLSPPSSQFPFPKSLPKPQPNGPNPSSINQSAVAQRFDNSTPSSHRSQVPSCRLLARRRRHPPQASLPSAGLWAQLQTSSSRLHSPHLIAGLAQPHRPAPTIDTSDHPELHLPCSLLPPKPPSSHIDPALLLPTTRPLIIDNSKKSPCERSASQPTEPYLTYLVPPPPPPSARSLDLKTIGPIVPSHPSFENTASPPTPASPHGP